MKTTRSFSIGLLAALGAFFIIGANPTAYSKATKSSSSSNGIFANSGADGGRLIIKRSAVAGRNITFNLNIDGQPAGSIYWGRTYDRFITPGKHVLSLGYESNRIDWKGTLDVRAGQTYTYVASFGIDKVRLDPAR